MEAEEGTAAKAPPPARAGPVSRRRVLQLGLAGGAGALLPGSAAETAPEAPRSRSGRLRPTRGDWPMPRRGLLRDNRAVVRGKIRGRPEVAWRCSLGPAAGAAFTADLDEDGQPETYSAENWRIVRRDGTGRVIWRSPRICREFTLLGFEDLDGDGRREPLMAGSGLNPASPLYFIFDPHDGGIRWQAELSPSNGGDFRFGKLDPARKGLQLLRALFPNPGGGELHLFSWEQGIENGSAAWSWTRRDDFIYFPQLAVGDVDGDGQPEILMLSQMCVWQFDLKTGSEISRVAWGKRTRSYGGHFGVWPLGPGGTPGVLVVSAYNRVTVLDPEPGARRLKVRWDRAFEPDAADQDLKGQLQFLPDGACDVDGDGWAEIVCSEYAGYADRKWRTVVLGARDGATLAEIPGKVTAGAADLDGDGRAEVFLQDRVEEHDPAGGRVSVARWKAGGGLEVVWTAPEDGSLVREPNDPALRLSTHPNEGDRVKLAPGSRSGLRAFFLRRPDGTVQGYEADGAGFRPVEVRPPPDPTLPLSGLVARPPAPPPPPLAADWDGDGVNEVVQQTSGGDWLVLKGAGKGQPEPRRIAALSGIRGSPLFADLDGDGRLELIAVRLGEAAGGERRQPCLEVTRPDGTLLWRRSWPADHAYRHTLGEGGFAIMFVAVGRFTGKNPLDVAVSYTGEQAGGHTAVLDGATGATVWDLRELYPGIYGNCWDAHPPVVFDYDGDGLDDLATVCQTVHYTILRGRDGRQLLEKPRDASSQGFGGETALFPRAWAVGPRLGGADVDGDGRPELAVFSSQACVGVLRAGGEPLWFLDLPVVKQVPTPGCWADVDGDGKPEAAFLFKDGWVRVYDGRTGKLRWEENVGALGSLLAADIDGDGIDELLVSSEQGLLTCLGRTAGATSRIRWSLELDGTPGAAIFADIDGDGAGEILVPASDGFLYCLAPPRGVKHPGPKARRSPAV